MQNWMLRLSVFLVGILGCATPAAALFPVASVSHRELAPIVAERDGDDGGGGGDGAGDGMEQVLKAIASGTSGRLLAGGVLLLTGLRLLELTVRFVAAAAAAGGMWGMLWLTEHLHGSPLPLWTVVALLGGAGSVGWQVARMQGSSVGEWLARGLALLGTLGISGPLAQSLGIDPSAIVLAAGAGSLASPALGIAILSGGMVGTAIPNAGPLGVCASLIFSIIWTRMMLGPRGWFGPLSVRPLARQ